jgi:hypothetical protein
MSHLMGTESRIVFFVASIKLGLVKNEALKIEKKQWLLAFYKT